MNYMKEVKLTRGEKTPTPKNKILQKYFAEINKIPVLTEEEEIAIVKRIEQGDETALNELVVGHLRFVVSIAKKYQNNGLFLSDLINEGNIGLKKAAKKFDGTKGFKFISYAVRWVRQAIIAAVNEKKKVVRYPLNITTTANKIKKITSSLEQTLERAPVYLEITTATGLSIDEIVNSKGCFSSVKSFDTPLNEGNGRTIIDLYVSNDPRPDYNIAHVESIKNKVQEILSYVGNKSSRKNQILDMYYFQDMTLDSIADKLGLTRERVRQIKKKTLEELRIQFPDAFEYLKK